jgi:hypothetical protein
MADIEQILEDRGSEYGDYAVLAEVTQAVKTTLRAALDANPRVWALTGEERAALTESLDMIALKAARLAVGNPGNVDSWNDIMGYARLGRDHVCTRGQPE